MRVSFGGSRRGKREPCLYLSLHPLTVDDTPAKLLLWHGSSGRSAGETIFRGLRKILITPVLQSKGRRVPRVRDGMAGTREWRVRGEGTGGEGNSSRSGVATRGWQVFLSV